MVRSTQVFVAIAAVVTGTSAQSCQPINTTTSPVFKDGYSGRVVINGLKTPRHILFDKQGNLLTAEQGAYGIRYIQLTDNGGTDICAKANKQLIADSTLNHGIDLSADGKKLYASSNANVFSWDYDGTTGTVSNRKTLIQGMTQTGHRPKTLLLPKLRPDLLIVHRGSDGNIDNTTKAANSGKSQLRVFKIADIETGVVDYTSGDVLAWGLRNTVAVGEDGKGGIWTVDNGMDNMDRNGKDIHLTNPCEELNFHGYVNETWSAPETNKANNFGYPECASVWDPTVLPPPLNTELTIGSTISYGSQTTSEICAARQPAKLCFPAHTAPLDIKFNVDSSAAYITFHGSWNKQPPDGYRLSRVQWDVATGMPVEDVTSATAADNVMVNADNTKCPSGCFRPVGLAWDAEGRLFMSSDTTGEIWVVGGAK